MDELTVQGLATALEITFDEARELQAFAAGEQLALFPSKAAQDMGGSEERAERGKPGRPLGSRNKSTEDWVKYLRANYPNPLIFWAETIARPTPQLALELQCPPLEAFKIQMLAARELALYTNSKQPVAIDLGDGGLVSLTLITGGEQIGGAAAIGGGDMVTIDVEVDEEEDADKSTT